MDTLGPPKLMTSFWSHFLEAAPGSDYGMQHALHMPNAPCCTSVGAKGSVARVHQLQLAHQPLVTIIHDRRVKCLNLTGTTQTCANDGKALRHSRQTHEDKSVQATGSVARVPQPLVVRQPLVTIIQDRHVKCLILTGTTQICANDGKALRHSRQTH